MIASPPLRYHIRDGQRLLRVHDSSIILISLAVMSLDKDATSCRSPLREASANCRLGGTDVPRLLGFPRRHRATHAVMPSSRACPGPAPTSSGQPAHCPVLTAPEVSRRAPSSIGSPASPGPDVPLPLLHLLQLLLLMTIHCRLWLSIGCLSDISLPRHLLAFDLQARCPDGARSATQSPAGQARRADARHKHQDPNANVAHLCPECDTQC